MCVYIVYASKSKLVFNEGFLLPGSKGQRGKLDQPGVLGEKEDDCHSNVTTGVVYIRWGRTSCPGDAQLLYKGKTDLGLGCKQPRSQGLFSSLGAGKRCWERGWDVKTRNLNRQIQSVDSNRQRVEEIFRQILMPLVSCGHTTI